MTQAPLNALRAFEAVVRLGSSNAAARALFVTQSAVSHQVRNLEDWLGHPLFDRRGGRPRLLPHGEELARGLSLALAEIDAACDRAKARSAPQPLVIAAIPSVAVCWLIPRLSAFRSAHPDIAIRVVYAIHGHGIDFRDVDLAFVFAEGAPVLPGVQAELFLPGASTPVCSPSLMAAFDHTPPTASDLIHAGLLHDTDTDAWRTWLMRAGVPMPGPLKGPVFEDFNLLRAAALVGQGVAICPLAMIRDDLDRGHLVQLSQTTVLEPMNYYLLAAETADPARRAAADAFRDWAFSARSP